MLKRLLLLSIILTHFFAVTAQLNMTLVGQLTFPTHGDLSDVWGHIDGNGNEYALVGCNDGTSIVDISTPSNPVEVFYSYGPSSIWRDLKVWNNHAYIVNESTGGLKIIDMSNLPGSITTSGVYNFSGDTYPFSKAHDLYIDENGICYVFGADNGNGGVIMLDLSDPTAPIEVGIYDDFYLHDGMVRGDTLWGGAVNDGYFVVVNVSNKSNPITMATHTTPSAFTHNCWISDDGQTLFTTDEKSNAFIASFDVSDLSNISELDRTQSSPGENVIPHNTFVKGNYVITSYYRDGVTIHDASIPSNMVEVGNYDTSPSFSGNGFNGCWGVYPYLPSNLILATDIENGLYILSANYSPAAHLEGNVTDLNTSLALDGVQINIVSTTTSTNSNILGDYQTGIATAGTYDVTFTKSGYQTKTITGVILTSGNITTLNTTLAPLVSFTLQGQVIENSSSNPIENANVKIWSNNFTTTIQTNASGNFTIPNFFEGIYNVSIAKWGYTQLCLSNQALNNSNNTHIFQMENGYSDNFAFNLGWTISGNASTGIWERAEPNGTTYNGNPSNPGNDSQSDCGEEAYVTGNGGGSGGDDDVDEGITVLTSPIFDLSSYSDAYISFERWFYNAGGSSTPNDSLTISLSNGTTSQLIDFADIDDDYLGEWTSKVFQISNLIATTNNMILTVKTTDLPGGHISEGGFDNFRITEGTPTGIIEDINRKLLTVYPNPFNSEINILLENKELKTIRIEILDVTGKVIDQKVFSNTSIRFKNNYQKGLYFMNVYGDGELISTEKIIKL